MRLSRCLLRCNPPPHTHTGRDGAAQTPRKPRAAAISTPAPTARLCPASAWGGRRIPAARPRRRAARGGHARYGAAARSAPRRTSRAAPVRPSPAAPLPASTSAQRQRCGNETRSRKMPASARSPGTAGRSCAGSRGTARCPSCEILGGKFVVVT